MVPTLKKGKVRIVSTIRTNPPSTETWLALSIIANLHATMPERMYTIIRHPRGHIWVWSK